MRRQTLSLATCIVFVLLAAASKKKEPEKKLSTATPTLAQIAANEKAMSPKSVTPSAHGDVATYADMPGATNVARASAKERPGAWRITLSAPGDETFTPWSFAPGGASLAPDPAGAVGLPSEWFELADGPLKGAVAHLPGYIGSLGTPGLQCHSAELSSSWSPH